MSEKLRNFVAKLRGAVSSVKPKGGWLYSKKLLIVASLLISIGCWIFVTLYVNADSQKTVQDVPITIDTSVMQENFGLELIDILAPDELSNGKVDIVVKGSVYQIGKVSAENITVTTQTSSVNKAGEYTLALNLNCSNREVQVDIKEGSKTITAWFDSKKDKTLTLDVPQPIGATVTGSGLSVGEPVGSIKSIAINGPATVIDMVASARLCADVNSELVETTTVPAALFYFDAEGNVLDTELTKYITITDYNNDGTVDTPAGAPASGDITVMLPVTMECELPVKLAFKNVPEGFNTDTLKYTLSNKSIKLEGGVADMQQFSDRGSYELEAIDLHEIKPENTRFVIPLNFASSIKSVDGVTEVEVNFNLNNYATETYTVDKSRIKLINTEGGKASVVSEKVNVTIVGPLNTVGKLNENNISLVIDMSADEWTPGTKTVSASVVVAGNSYCWEAGTTNSVKVKVE